MAPDPPLLDEDTPEESAGGTMVSGAEAPGPSALSLAGPGGAAAAAWAARGAGSWWAGGRVAAGADRRLGCLLYTSPSPRD
eukprot:12724112-Alexandrium_andersonii.AAC.1